MTGVALGKGTNEMLLARVNALREEPGGASRFFVADLNGPLYILDKQTKKLMTYLDFNGREGHSGLFHNLSWERGYGNGLNGFYFDPDYKRNGKFYTVHMEDPALTGSSMPDNKNFPGLNLSGYTTTPLISTPGPNVNANFVYDGMGRREKKTINGSLTEFLYDDLNPVQETSGATVLKYQIKSGKRRRNNRGAAGKPFDSAPELDFGSLSHSWV